MQRYITFAIKEMSKLDCLLGRCIITHDTDSLVFYFFPSYLALFYMHRGFFAQALEDNPTDPMGSKYSPSVLAAYGSATAFVGLIESLFNQHPQLTERMWFLFTHVFSCAVRVLLLHFYDGTLFLLTNPYVDCLGIYRAEIADGAFALGTFAPGFSI